MSNKPNCGDCIFYKRQARAGRQNMNPSEMLGICHRFPQPVPVNAAHWCGEFKAPMTEEKPRRARRKAATEVKQ